MNTQNLAIAKKSLRSCLNCKVEIEKIDREINQAQKELSLLQLSNKAYTPKDIERKNKLELALEDLRSLKRQFEIMSKFNIGDWVRNGTPNPGQVKGLYLVENHPKVAVLYDGQAEIKHERPAQLTIVNDDYLEYIWNGEENAPKLIRKGDQKVCVDLKILEDNFISSSNIRDTHQDCEAEPEYIEPYNRQLIWCKKQYLKITRDLYPEGSRVKVDQQIGTVLAYSERNPAYLQKVEVKLDSGTIKKFYPTQISLLEKEEIKTYSEQEAKLVSFCSRQPDIQKLLIAKIRRNGGTQQRTGLNKETVINYAELMRDGGVKFPPVKVKFDGTDYWLYDGFHTTEAAWSIGETNIEAEITEGTQRDAILLSFGVNADHGLPRSNADKRHAVNNMLDDSVWSTWSNVQIAKFCNVTEGLVRKIKKERESVQMNGVVQYEFEDFSKSDKQAKDELLASVNHDFTDNSQTLPISSTDNDSSVQTNCPDKKNTVQINCPDKLIVDDFKVGQVVRIEVPSDRPDKRLVGHNHSFAVVTGINPSTLDLKIYSQSFSAVSPNDISNNLKLIDQNHITICMSASVQDVAKLLTMFDSKEEIIKAAIAARSLDL